MRSLRTPAVASLCAALFASAAGLSAQVDYTISPPGTELLEGNSASAISVGHASARVQQVDNSVLGSNLRLVRSMSWRRDRTFAAVTTSHTFEMTITMGHADFSNVTNTFATNFKTAGTVVFPKARVKVDWSTAPKTTPPQYDLTFPFKSVFLYNQKDALVWDAQTTTGGSNVTNYYQDWFSTAPTTTMGLRPTVLSTGCTTGNGVFTLNSTFQASATTFSFGWDVKGAPANAPVSVWIGLNDPNRSLFCGTLNTDALIPISLGTADASGNIAMKLTNTPWNQTLAGAYIYNQALAPDKNAFGASLSTGLLSTAPRVPGGTAIAVRRTFSSSSATATAGSTPSASAVAVRYN